MAPEDMTVWEEHDNENRPMGYFDAMLFEHVVSRDDLIHLRANIDGALGEQRYSRAEVEAAILYALDRGWSGTNDLLSDVFARLDSARTGTQEGE